MLFTTVYIAISDVLIHLAVFMRGHSKHLTLDPPTKYVRYRYTKAQTLYLNH